MRFYRTKNTQDSLLNKLLNSQKTIHVYLTEQQYLVTQGKDIDEPCHEMVNDHRLGNYH